MKVKPGLLYVNQMEYAVVRDADERVTVIGSDKAVTCHIVIFHHQDSNGVAVAHFDGFSCDLSHLTNMVTDLLRGSANKTVDVYAIGGVYEPQKDTKGSKTSQNLSVKLLRHMMN